MSLAGLLAAHVAAIEDLLWPPVCPECDARAGDPAGLFCDECWAGLRPLRPGSDADLLPGTPAVFAAYSVDARFLKILTTSKYGGYRDVGKKLCAHAAKHVAPRLPVAALVPVPITRSKRRERGFNQTDDFARALARSGRFVARPDWLVRRRGGRALAGRSRESRARVVAGAFEAARAFPGESAGPLLLVDDVVTTGSTACASADALAARGNRPIGVVAMGRAFAPLEDTPPPGDSVLSRI